MPDTDPTLMASRRGIVHALKPGFPNPRDAETLCGKWSRDLTEIPALGDRQRMCRTCGPAVPQPEPNR